MDLYKPFNLLKWIQDNQAKLKPPVCNKIVYSNHDFIVMIVGGPNQRKDYHINKTAEIFYQLKGNMILKIINNNNKIEDILIKEGEMFQLPPNIPHSPQRFDNTMGLVVESARKNDQMDTLLWLCEECNIEYYQESFLLKNIESDFEPIFRRYQEYKNNNTCQNCL